MPPQGLRQVTLRGCNGSAKCARLLLFPVHVRVAFLQAAKPFPFAGPCR